MQAADLPLDGARAPEHRGNAPPIRAEPIRAEPIRAEPIRAEDVLARFLADRDATDPAALERLLEGQPAALAAELL